MKGRENCSTLPTSYDFFRFLLNFFRKKTILKYKTLPTAFFVIFALDYGTGRDTVSFSI